MGMLKNSIMSSVLTFFCLFLQTLLVWCNTDISHCPLFMKPSIFRDGDLILDGFFALYYLNIQPKIQLLSFLQKPMECFPDEWIWSSYPLFLAFLFAIDEINKDINLLPNVTLGFNVYNALNNDHTSLENILLSLSGGNQPIPNYNCKKQKVSAGIIVGTMPEFLEDTGLLLELYRIPQLSSEPLDYLPTDKEYFPSVYSMTPKENILVHGLACLVQHFNWTWVHFFSTFNIKVTKMLYFLEYELLKKGICRFYKRVLYDNDIRNAKLKTKRAFQCEHYADVNVSIVYGEAEILKYLHLVATVCSLSGRMWIVATELHIDLGKMKSTTVIFHGSLSFSVQKRDVPGFEHFVKTFSPSKYPEDFYTIKFWLDRFNCSFAGSLCGSLQECPPNSSLEFMPENTDLMTMSELSYAIYNAVYALSTAVHEMLLAKAETELRSDTDQAVLFSWKLHPFLKAVQFTNSIGDQIALGDERSSKQQLDILNIVMFPAAHDSLDNIGAHGFMAKVGEFVFLGPNNQTLVINEAIIEWPLGLKEPPTSMCAQRCRPGFRKIPNEKEACCFKCVFCSMGEISNTTDALRCIQCSEEEYSNLERTQCIPKLVTYLAFEDFLGMTLSCTAVCFSVLTSGVLWIFMKYRDTPMVKANNRTLSYILLISLLLCFLCSFLFIGRPNTITCILQQVTFGIVFTLAVSTVLAKTITVILAFKAMKPGRTMRWLLVSGASNYVIPICTVIQVIICGIWIGLYPPFIDIDAHSEPTHLLIVCNKGSVTAFYCVLGYLGSLALVSFSLSYLVRNLPDTFNEAKFLTFSMLVFCSIWVTFLPVYHSAQGKAMVTLEIFSILASSAGLLVCIFAPKCYIILLRPEKNSLKQWRSKMAPIANKHS